MRESLTHYLLRQEKSTFLLLLEIIFLLSQATVISIRLSSPMSSTILTANIELFLFRRRSAMRLYWNIFFRAWCVWVIPFVTFYRNSLWARIRYSFCHITSPCDCISLYTVYVHVAIIYVLQNAKYILIFP